ncbi:MAG TPA: glycoside hydrolase family 15 protein [Acidimicrobiia bacterium]
MASRIESYALLSDMQSAALVGLDGSIDWLTFPRFDSPAVFAALLGEPRHGRWLVAPASEPKRVRRQYWGDSLVLETVFECDDGEVAVIDCMPARDRHLNVVRLVEGRRGRVAMRSELTIRFGYGAVVPWVRNLDGTLRAVAGPDALCLRTPVHVRGGGDGDDRTSVADFSVAAGDQVPFVLSWHPSHTDPDDGDIDAAVAIAETERWWRDWAGQTKYVGEWGSEVRRSLTVLKGLTYEPTGGLCAAATTSLPEAIGGVRNWDYRHCWLRDATFTLMALMAAGHTDEAAAWRDWLLRAIAGDPDDLQIMYGLAGERRLTEMQLEWLPGYEGSKPVRVGNAAYGQFQLDVYGEVMDAMYQASVSGIAAEDHAWDLQTSLLEYLEGAWRQPDEGIWEVRGERQHFTHSKVMAWVAVDRAVRSARLHRLHAPLHRWIGLRDEIHREVLANGVDDRGVFMQSYGSKHLDASVLNIPLVGFLPATDPRVVNTVEAIQRELMDDGFVVRYRTESNVDGLPGQEGSFLLCTFWLADALALMHRTDEARALFEKLLALRNDVGLLAEEYDPTAKRMLGNFPQAFSHTAIITTAATLSQADGVARPAQQRSRIPTPGNSEAPAV